jgi:serine protease AprX
MRFRLPLLLGLLLVLLGAGLAPRPLEAVTRRPVLIVLRAQADLRGARGLLKKQARGAAVVAQLRRRAERDQPQIMALLRARGIEGRGLLSLNAIAAEVDEQTLALLRRHPAVGQVLDNGPRQVLEPQPAQSPDAPQAPDAPNGVEWGLADINADDVWSTYGVTGTGVVVAGSDTGIDWDHPALIGKYRGWDGASANHVYNWHDSVHAEIYSGQNPCGIDLQQPCDDHGHGTHTLGTMVGDDGAGNQVGVAPGAKWIGCRNMESGWGTIEAYVECFDWYLAPTDAQGQNPRPDLAPHIINNSWGCTSGEGCNAAMLGAIEPAIHAATEAGILVVGSAGNSGASTIPDPNGCGTINEPPALYPDVLTVGAYTSGGALASFSSRGPISYGGVTRVGPDLTAPGVSVRSAAYNSSGYTTMQGTSMASPHVAGAAALLWSARPELQGQIELTKQILRRTSRAKGAGVTACDADPNAVPNNLWGWGRLDALAAVQEGLTTGTLTVTVLQGWDGQPFTGVEIAVEGEYSLDLLSDGAGQAATPLPAGTYRATASYGLYQTSAMVTVEANTPLTITLTLARKSYAPLIELE